MQGSNPCFWFPASSFCWSRHVRTQVKKPKYQSYGRKRYAYTSRLTRCQDLPVFLDGLTGHGQCRGAWIWVGWKSPKINPMTHSSMRVRSNRRDFRFLHFLLFLHMFYWGVRPRHDMVLANMKRSKYHSHAPDLDACRVGSGFSISRLFKSKVNHEISGNGGCVIEIDGGSFEFLFFRLAPCLGLTPS